MTAGDRSVIAGLAAHDHLGHADRRMDFQTDPSPLAVFDVVRGAVAEDILILEFDSDLGADIGQFKNGFRKESPATGEVSQIFDSRAASAAGCEAGIIVAHNADCVK